MQGDKRLVVGHKPYKPSRRRTPSRAASFVRKDKLQLGREQRLRWSKYVTAGDATLHRLAAQADTLEGPQEQVETTDPSYRTLRYEELLARRAARSGKFLLLIVRHGPTGLVGTIA